MGVYRAEPAHVRIEPSGGVCTWTANACTFTAAGLNQSVIATFTLKRYLLNITGEGFGYRIVYVEPRHLAEALRALRGGPGPLPFVSDAVSANPRLARAGERSPSR